MFVLRLALHYRRAHLDKLDEIFENAQSIHVVSQSLVLALERETTVLAKYVNALPHEIT